MAYEPNEDKKAKLAIAKKVSKDFIGLDFSLDKLKESDFNRILEIAKELREMRANYHDSN